MKNIIDLEILKSETFNKFNRLRYIFNGNNYWKREVLEI